MLRPKKKMTKKELKKDPVLEKIAQFNDMVRRNQKIVTYVAVGLVVVIALTILMLKSKQKANLEAMGELGLAEQSLARNDYDDAILRLEGITSRYKRTKGAGIATLLLGQAYAAKDDWENARVQYEKYLDDYNDDDLLAASAYQGLGIWAERSGDWLKAAGYFKKAGKVAPYKYLRHEAYINAVRCYLKAEQLKPAKEILELVITDKPEGKYKSDSEALQAEILTRSAD